MNNLEVNAITLKSVMEDFLFHCRFEKNLNAKTIASYSTDLQQFEKFACLKKCSDNIYSIDKEIIKSYLQELAKFKPKTVKRKVASLKAMFTYVEYDNDLFINPFRKIKIRLKEPYILPSVLTIGEIERILAMLYKERAGNTRTESYSYKAQTRNIVIAELLFATGVRVTELCELKNSHIDMKEGVIKVHGKGSRERIIQICNKETLSVLKNYFKLFKSQIDRSDYFFINRLNEPLKSQSVRNLVKSITKKTGLTKHITPHTFRHTFATLLLEEDVDIKYIQSLLGHSSIATTQIYTHVNTEKQKKILSTKHPRQRFKISNV
jgi:integrase/recombinase XerD